MQSIVIRDLACSRELSQQAMSAVRGGIMAGGPNVNVNVNLDQKIGQFQKIQVNVLNGNGVIGAGFSGPTLDVSPSQWAMNEAALPLQQGLG
jgi:hypothetical protein